MFALLSSIIITSSFAVLDNAYVHMLAQRAKNTTLFLQLQRLLFFDYSVFALDQFPKLQCNICIVHLKV